MICEIEQIAKMTQSVKTTIIEGGVQCGKTTLAQQIAHYWETKGQREYFTTPAIQNTWGARTIEDRTGVYYGKLPLLRDLKEDGDKTLIVVDEISGRIPDWMGGWRGYAAEDITNFLILNHSGNPTLGEWLKLFEGISPLMIRNMGRVGEFVVSGEWAQAIN